MASGTIPRLYHSIALLLPDARVLMTGGNGYNQAEIFSPPYLFTDPRPTIASMPAKRRIDSESRTGCLRRPCPTD